MATKSVVSANGKAAGAVVDAPDEVIAKIQDLRRIEEQVLIVDIIGTTPVIPHKWSAKAIKQMADKQQTERGAAKVAREPKVPLEEALGSCYWFPTETMEDDLRLAGMLRPDSDRPGYESLHPEALARLEAGIPAVSFKAAMVGAVRFFDGLTMTLAKLLFYVEGYGDEQLVRVGSNKVMREDTPRNAGGTPDLRYRFMIGSDTRPWTARLRVHYLPTLINPRSVVNLLDAAGKGGVGDWRPSSPKSSTGSYGQWRVVTEDDRNRPAELTVADLDKPELEA